MHFRSTEHDHVKTNLPHKIHHIFNIGILKLDEFKELISSADYANYVKKKSRTTWYPLTVNVFATLVYKVQIFIFICFYV